MNETLELRIDEAWKSGLGSWNNPSIPYAITPKNGREVAELGDVGRALRQELAFMKFPEFQTYLNLEKILQTFPKDTNRALNAISAHEIGHRFCPYDLITSILLGYSIKKELEGEKLPYSTEAASKLILNLFSDMCINTTSVRRGNVDIPWMYQELSKNKKEKKLWRVYGKSMELAWNQDILPKDTKLSEEELEASKELSNLFKGNFFDKDKWRSNIINYARVISKFLDNEDQDRDTTFDDVSSNIPENIDEKTASELAKRLAEIGSNGLPTNPDGLKEFKEIMAGFGQGNPIEASITFYDRLSDAYNVSFATRPFGRPRPSPFQPVKWNPSMGAEKLDVDYSVNSGGKIIPGVNTYLWKTRKRESHGGLEEIVPDLDLYLDSSMSMPNPVEIISLPVLAGFVVAKKAHRKGASIRSTNFSGNNQSETVGPTRNLDEVFRNLVKFYRGGTVFPVEKLSEGNYPKQVLVITDTFLGNESEAANSIAELKNGNRSNRVTIYALHPSDNAAYLRNAGAEVIHGTNTDIFKRVIGKAEEVYTI